MSHMDSILIQDIVTEYRKSIIQSEAEIRSKLIVPLLEAMGYPSEFRAEEFPVYGFGGRERLSPKSADFILFNHSDFAFNRNYTQNDLNWVFKHSLLVVEAKKPGKMTASRGQAQFYCCWTRSVAYIETDGEHFYGYFFNPIANDHEVLDLKVDELPLSNNLWQLSYERVCEIKKEGTLHLEISDAVRNASCEIKSVEGDELHFNIPAERMKYFRSALDKDAVGLSDEQVIKKYLNLTDTCLLNDLRYNIPPFMMDIPRRHFDGYLYIDNSVFPIIKGQVREYYWNDYSRYQFDSRYIKVDMGNFYGQKSFKWET